MLNRFEASMAKRSDEELIKIVTLERDHYQPEAVDAAEAEVRKRNIDTALIETTAARLKAEEHRQKQENAGREDLGLRAVHLFVDTILYYALGFAFTITGMNVVAYTGAMMGREADVFGRMVVVMVVLAFFVYYVGMEFFFQRTVGKFITGTKVVMANGNKPQFMDIFRRTCCRLIPLDAVSFWFRKYGFHDDLSETRVVEKNFIFDPPNTPESSSPAI